MGRAALEVADIFRTHGPAWRQAQHDHLSLAQLQVMSAIEQCRSAALGGHVLRCEGCGTDLISYNSRRNRHCPKCQSRAAQRWLSARQADLLPLDYYHVVFTLPAPVAEVAYQNKAAVYALLFDVAAEVLLTIAADPRHLGARIGATFVLHTWGSALTHHPHVHGIVPGGGLAPDGSWRACRAGFFLPVRVLSRLFRRRFLEELQRLHQLGRLRFFGELAALAEPRAFAQWLAPLRSTEWVVYAKRPFAGPAAVLAYLSRYTHRVAISNSRLLGMDERGVTFRWKDYRARGSARRKVMTLSSAEFMRRFLLHVLPAGLHRIRHYGLLANGNRRASLAAVREQLLRPSAASTQPVDADPHEAPAERQPTFVCRHCGRPLVLVETLPRGACAMTAHTPQHRTFHRPLARGARCAAACADRDQGAQCTCRAGRIRAHHGAGPFMRSSPPLRDPSRSALLASDSPPQSP